MMKPIVILAVVALLTAALAGCGQDSDFAMESKVTALERSLADQKAALAKQGERLETLEKQNAELQKAMAQQDIVATIMRILKENTILSDLLTLKGFAKQFGDVPALLKNIVQFQKLADAFEGIKIQGLLKDVADFKNLFGSFKGVDVSKLVKEMASVRKFMAAFAGTNISDLLQKVKNNKASVGSLFKRVNQIDALVKALSGKLLPTP